MGRAYILNVINNLAANRQVILKSSSHPSSVPCLDSKPWAIEGPGLSYQDTKSWAP
jgi:hypothetical protein